MPFPSTEGALAAFQSAYQYASDVGCQHPPSHQVWMKSMRAVEALDALAIEISGQRLGQSAPAKSG